MIIELFKRNYSWIIQKELFMNYLKRIIHFNLVNNEYWIIHELFSIHELVNLGTE